MNPSKAVCNRCGRKVKLFRDVFDESRLRYVGHSVWARRNSEGALPVCAGSGELWGESPRAAARKGKR